ncbi:helix-turn-helix domain-containing protein [Cupriavidus sp. DB3]|uniref:transcriptional regulator n=1 Tax=Cupriavidus sp. DB3 TaxID=2873259 RepID=UPI001CF177D3|nr:helix-turn-helix domain-containing protein [Cupriavidus sp. DB3]MCA7086077.1 helix-turn-helix domain-containing protein [Cupriavidus sp. DB3]
MKLAEYLDSTKTSQSAFAKRLGVSQGLVYQWLSGKRPISAEQCPVIERLTGGLVTCEELNDKVDWAYVRGTGPQANAQEAA